MNLVCPEKPQTLSTHNKPGAKESKIFMSFVVINQVVLKGQELIGSAEEPSPVAKMLEEWET